MVHGEQSAMTTGIQTQQRLCVDSLVLQSKEYTGLVATKPVFGGFRQSETRFSLLSYRD